ncbi:MAG TPA: YIP1 family protein [Pirellulales bacterium]|nr:YIP1 family protein [Pirellulales bacterium]
MPIEFRCGQCGKLLRTADNTAGKQAKCPSCGTVQPVPAVSGGGPLSGTPTRGVFGETPSPPPGQGAFGEIPSAPPIASDNPYASPLSTEPSFEYRTGYAGPRTGPPWERNGPSIASFIETIKLAYSSLGLFFTDMRREGGFGRPLGFSLAGVTFGIIVFSLWQMVFQLITILVGAPAPAFDPARGVGYVVGFALGLVVLVPLFTVLQSFITAAIYHVCLMMLGGAKQPFETTYRVVAYSTGSSAILMLIPFCGQTIYGIVNLVFSAIGLMHAHETSGLKATFAVLLPMFICCGLVIAFYAFVIGVVVMNAR